MQTMGQFTDVKWPAEYTELTRIEELLHCKICYEYMKTSVVTPCSHNFCSICIRKYLLFKTQCPMCLETIYDKDLHANRILDEFMESYLSLREKLFLCIKGAKLESNNRFSASFASSMPNTPSKPKSSRFVTQTPKKLFRDKPGESPRNSFTPKEKARDTQLLKTPNSNVPGSSNGEKTPNPNHIFAINSAEKVVTDSNRKRVPCPVCSIEISETYINKHLDDCLKRQKSMSPPKSVKNGLEPMPKLVTNLMKDGELRKTLKKYGLPTSGTRKALEKRIQKFSVLYNAERDKVAPKSVEELVKLCEEEENTEKNIVKQNSSDLILNIDRKTDPNVIEKAHKQYLQRHKDEYQKLIESINSRETGRTKKLLGRSLFSHQETGEDCLATTSSADQTFFNRSFENNDTNSSVADTSHCFPQDSDSTNTSYPLQHYSKDDPMQFLALEISSDSQESPVKLNSSIDQPSPEWKMKSDCSQVSRNDSDVIMSSNPSLSGTMFSISSKNSSLLEAGKSEVVNNDIFDASTEDNWSDSGAGESAVNKSKKFTMKRGKVEAGNLSTDTETDVETTRVGHSGRKSAKIRRNRAKLINKAKDNGVGRGDKSPVQDLDAGISSSASIGDKENSDIDGRRAIATARRSSRNKNPVSYAVNITRKKKALDEVQQNCFGSSKLAGETKPALRSLRKGRKP